MTVILVDDERLIRSALAQALAAEGLDLVGEAASATEAMKLVVDLRPDVVLMDLKLPGSKGVETIQRLGLLAPASRILILTRTEENRVVEAIVAGASGYILKTSEPETIVAAVNATAAGESVDLRGDRRKAAAAHPRARHPDHDRESQRRERDSCGVDAARTGDLHAAGERQEQSRNRRRAAHSARTRSRITSRASSPSCISTTGFRPPFRPCAAASPSSRLPRDAARGPASGAAGRAQASCWRSAAPASAAATRTCSSCVSLTRWSPALPMCSRRSHWLLSRIAPRLALLPFRR